MHTQKKEIRRVNTHFKNAPNLVKKRHLKIREIRTEIVQKCAKLFCHSESLEEGVGGLHPAPDLEVQIVVTAGHARHVPLFPDGWKVLRILRGCVT